MKKSIAILLTLCLCVGLCACSVEIPKFTVEEFTNALLSKDIEFDNSTISQTGDFLFYSDHHIVSGTADKNQNVTYAMLVNMGVDASVFDNQAKFETWLAETAEMDIGSSSLREIDKLIATNNCIDELMVFYELANGEDDPFDFAVDTLLRKESTKVNGWKIKVSVDSDASMLITEIISKGASASVNPFAAFDELLLEIEYQQMIDTLSTDPATPYAFFLENKDYKDCAQYLEKFELVCVAEKTNDSYTTFTYNNGLIIQEKTSNTDGVTKTTDYTYSTDGKLLKTDYELKSKVAVTQTVTDYDEYGYPASNQTYIDGTLKQESIFVNAYYSSGNIKSCEKKVYSHSEKDGRKVVALSVTNYEENGDYVLRNEMSFSNVLEEIVKYDDQGRIVYHECQYKDKPSTISIFEYEYDNNGNLLYKRLSDTPYYYGYEYNENGMLTYSYYYGYDNMRSSEVWYEYAHVYHE